MCDSTSNPVHRSILVRLQEYPLFDPDAELFSEATALAQCSQSSHPSSNCFYDMNFPLVPNPPDPHTSIGPIPDSSYIQSLVARWQESSVGRCPLRELSAPNELIVSSLGEVYEDDSVMEHRPALNTPIIPQIGLLRTETLLSQSGISPISSPISPRGLEESSSESFSQTGCVSPSQECYILWKKIPADAVIVTGCNKFVPQTLYKPFTEADKERYLEQICLSAPIIFMTKGSLEWGISLEDVRNGRTQQLVDKDVPVLQDCGPSVSIRINWPGYPSFKRQISSRNWRKMKGPITKEKLVHNLAKTTGRFIEKMSNRPLEVGTESSWKVGPQYIKVEDLILVSLHHVSKGSWQPQFRLRRYVA